MPRRSHIPETYVMDFFDPRTWYRGVFGEGTRNSDVGFGGYAGQAPLDSDDHFAKQGPARSASNESAPNYVGRGPKNFKRSDERIYESVCLELEHDHHIDASDVEVSVREGWVELTGYVRDREQKHLAEDLAESVPGVAGVRNRIEVKRGAFDPYPGYHWV